jgi:molybdopterin converting factor small subunit
LKVRCPAQPSLEKNLTEDKFRVLVNKQYSMPETKIADADVIAIVLSSPG